MYEQLPSPAISGSKICLSRCLKVGYLYGHSLTRRCHLKYIVHIHIGKGGGGHDLLICLVGLRNDKEWRKMYVMALAAKYNMITNKQTETYTTPFSSRARWEPKVSMELAATTPLVHSPPRGTSSLHYHLLGTSTTPTATTIHTNPPLPSSGASFSAPAVRAKIVWTGCSVPAWQGEESVSELIMGCGVDVACPLCLG